SDASLTPYCSHPSFPPQTDSSIFGNLFATT
ncbi:unnamed protein product, partial [Rotaria sp. Silwood2]